MGEDRVAGYHIQCPASGKLLPVMPRGRTLDDLPEGALSGPGWPYLELQDPVRECGHVVVVTPYAPDHKRMVRRCQEVVEKAWAYSKGPFSSMEHVCIEDADRNGPGWGRNKGVFDHPEADWYLYVDADDMLCPHAFEAMNWVESETDIIWGVIVNRSFYEQSNDFRVGVSSKSFRTPTFDQFVGFGHDGGAGFNNAFYVRGDLQRKFRWMMDPVYEDIELYMCLMSEGTYQRVPFPLVVVDSMSASTVTHKKSGRKYEEVFSSVQNFWRGHGRSPLSDDVREFRNSKRTMKEFYYGG